MGRAPFTRGAEALRAPRGAEALRAPLGERYFRPLRPFRPPRPLFRRIPRYSTAEFRIKRAHSFLENDWISVVTA